MKLILLTLIVMAVITLIIAGLIKLYARDKKHDSVLTWKVAGYASVTAVTTYAMLKNSNDSTSIMVNLAVVIVSAIELISNIIAFHEDYIKRNKK